MNTRYRWAQCWILAPVLAGALVLTGCGGGTTSTGTPTQQPSAAQAQPPTAAGQPASTEKPAAAAAPAAAEAPAATPAPPANAMVQEHETGIEVTLVELKRTSGDSVTLKWRYRNTTGTDVKLTKGGSNWYDPYRLTAESFLIDPVNKKKYLVITDDQRYPLTSKHGDWQGVSLAPGQTLSAWAKFPAPPLEVEKMSVTIGGVPPFEDVPVIK